MKPSPTTAPGISHNAAANLLAIAPSDLERLVTIGRVRRNDRNDYSVPVLVQDYIAHVQAQADAEETHPKQKEVAAHLDLSDRSVREIEARLNLPQDYTLTAFRIAYIRHLREVAAGRAGTGDLDLATERAGLAKEQKERVALQNAVTRRELAPVILIEQVLSKAGSKVAGILDGIPGMIKRRVSALTASDIAMIAAEIARARNIAAAVRLEDLQEDTQDGQSEPPPDTEVAEVAEELENADDESV